MTRLFKCLLVVVALAAPTGAGEAAPAMEIMSRHAPEIFSASTGKRPMEEKGMQPGDARLVTDVLLLFSGAVLLSFVAPLCVKRRRRRTFRRAYLKKTAADTSTGIPKKARAEPKTQDSGDCMDLAAAGSR